MTVPNLPHPIRGSIRQSGVDRLRKMPAIFRGSDLTVRFLWTSKSTSQALYLWKKRGWIEPLGGHSDVYANLLLYADCVDWERALLKAMPSAILVGLEPLRRANWMTQIPARPQVAVRKDGPVYNVDRFSVRPVSRTEHADLRGHLRADLAQSVPVLDPAYALVDLVQTQGWGACGIAPDDLYVEEMTERDRGAILQACDVLEVDPHVFDVLWGGSDLCAEAESERSASPLCPT